MKPVVFSILVMLVVVSTVAAQRSSRDAVELTRLLNEFLDGAGRNDVAVHDRFWAEDLIYTRAVGQRIGKTELMQSVRAAPTRTPVDSGAVYSAEDIRIQQYGATAVVAFRLVSRSEKDGKVQVAKFLNTGTFVKRKDKWQAVAWQATAIPIPK